LESVESIGKKNLYNPCPLLDNFIEFGRKKEEKKDRGSMLHILNRSIEGGDDYESMQTPSRSDIDAHHTNEGVYQTRKANSKSSGSQHRGPDAAGTSN
jgi:hypothetical protein